MVEIFKKDKTTYIFHQNGQCPIHPGHLFNNVLHTHTHREGRLEEFVKSGHQDAESSAHTSLMPLLLGQINFCFSWSYTKINF